jgi:predicted XRE-type DNA-binding protein
VRKRDEVDKLLADLKAWAEQAEHGEQKKLAEQLGVKQAKFNHWITGRRMPNLRDGLRLQAFLKNRQAKK